MIMLEDVTKKYNDHTAVDTVNFEVAAGELCTLIGPSGCGKSTLLRMVNRMIEPTSGKIWVNQQETIHQNEVELRRNIGYVIQNVGLFPHYTVSQNLAIVPKLLGKENAWNEKRMQEMMELVHLPQAYLSKYPHELSGGQAQRVGVARALMADPPVLLMDEPFSAVDPQTRWNLQQSFLEIQRELKKTVLFVTHDIEEALALGDSIALMKDGNLIQKADPKTLLLQPESNFVTEFIGYSFGVNLLAKFKVSDYMVVHECESRYQHNLIAKEANLKQALALMIQTGAESLGVTDGNTSCGRITFQQLQAVLQQKG
ncbi:MAG: ABC transporter ATP-binding protein [Culicoidibacterales bacterium]